MTLSLPYIVPLGSCAREAAALVAGLAMTAAVSGCATQECTTMGCADSFSITTTTADKSWAAGEYTLELTVDGDEVSCAYSWANMPQAGGGAGIQCSNAVAVSVIPVTTCTETTKGGSVSQGCTPVPGQFTQVLMIQGTPARVDVVVRRDGDLVGERSFTPEYQASYPNGEECGPACRQGVQGWELP